MRRRLITAGLAFAVVAGLASGPIAAGATLAADPTTSATAAASSSDASTRSGPKYKLLVLIPASASKADKAGVQQLRQLGVDRGFTVEATGDTTLVNEADLARFRAVAFLNTAGDLLTDAQQAAFEAYYRAGGGFLGLGSAIETEPDWPFFTELLGTRSTSKTAVEAGTIKVADRVHVATKNLPDYWTRTDAWYNFKDNVRGVSHVLATVVEKPFTKQPTGPDLAGIDGTMGADHPVAWCKDYKGGRSFYTGGSTSAIAAEPNFADHIAGAVEWTAGVADSVYSDCGATVLANYTQTAVTRNPNLNEPIGFDALPDGRIVQTDRRGSVRLHNPVSGTTTTLAQIPVYNNSEDGLYGPGMDNNFATNHWIYLYYAPPTVKDVKFADGTLHDVTTNPTGASPAAAADLSAWDQWLGYFQLSRVKFVDDAPGAPAHLDMATEQQILRVPNNRGACCHVAGDISFDKFNNLYLPTGDDSAAGSGDAGSWGQSIDQKYDDTQTVRVNNATGGTFTLTLSGQATAPIAWNADAAAISSAIASLSNVGAGNVQVTGTGTANTANQTVLFKGINEEKNVAQLTADTTGLTGTGTPAVAIATTREGGWFRNPAADSARSALNTNDLRGKVNRISVKAADIAPADSNKADYGTGGAYTIPAGNLFPLVAGAPQAKTRPEVYAMGFRNPFKISVDDDGVVYVSDYSPDSQTPAQFHGPAGTGRYEIIRKPGNYGWPYCFKPDLPEYPWNVNLGVPMDPITHQPTTDPQPYSCSAATVPNHDYWNVNGGPTVEPGLTETPALSAPDIWYSYRDNNTAAPLGTPCFAEYGPDALTAPIAPGSTTACPRLFPELYTGGVGPHGIAKYDYNSANTNPTKFPPYFDNSVILGEFTQNTMREVKLDSKNGVEKINPFMNCTSGTKTAATPFECTNPMDMFWGKDGNFYLMTYGNGFFNINPGAAIFKFSYLKGQRPPVAVVAADKTNGALPLTATFSSAGSNTPEPAESIAYSWNFGDGSATSMDPNPSHTYTTAGVYTAVLTVTASSGKTATASIPVTAGNTAPTVVVNTPVEGGTFAFGQDIPFTVTATDPEDGTVNCAEVAVTFVLGHDTHGHAEAGTTGCSGVLHTVAGDVSHGGSVFGVVSATYTDHGGVVGTPPLSTTAQHNVRQKHQEVEFVVNQSGTNTATNNDGGPVAPPSPGIHRGSLAAGDWIQLNGPFNLLNIDTLTFRVADAAAGRIAGSPLAAIEVHQDSLTGPIVATDNLVSTGDTAVWASQAFPISLSGTHELFLVFRSVTGGSTGGNLFNLNWAEFGGAGVATTP